MPQSELYKRSNKVDYVGGMPGTRVSEDLMIVRVDAGELDIEDRANRVLGNVDITNIPEPVQTVLYEALKSQGTDSLLVQEDTPLDVSGSTVPTEQQTPVSVEDSQGVNVDPATEQTIQSILDSVATNNTLSSELSREIGTWTAGVLPTEQQTPVGVEDSLGNQIDPATQSTLQSVLDSVSTESTLSAIAGALNSNSTDKLVVDHPNVIDVSSRDGRNLGDVDVISITDTVQTEDSDSGFFNAAAISGNGSVSLSLSAQGSGSVTGRVVSDGQYTVEISWKDDSGNEIFRDEVASAVAGGTTQKINKDAISPNADVIITDGSGTSSVVNATVHMT